jgi:hypothetical protein
MRADVASLPQSEVISVRRISRHIAGRNQERAPLPRPLLRFDLAAFRSISLPIDGPEAELVQHSRCDHRVELDFGPRAAPKSSSIVGGGSVTAADHPCFFFEPDPSLFRHMGGGNLKWQAWHWPNTKSPRSDVWRL